MDVPQPSLSLRVTSYLRSLVLLRVVRGLVSKKKRRFLDPLTGLDLDLSYISSSLVATGYPSQGIESLYRNPASSLRKLLARRHGLPLCRAWNLCIERTYPASLLDCTVRQELSWYDHTPPPFSYLRPLCEDIQGWVDANPANVAVIHCKAGKGRTGTVISAALVHSRKGAASADAALTTFGVRRTHNGRGVTLPSQARYVRYYGVQCAAGHASAAAAAATALSSREGHSSSSSPVVPSLTVALAELAPCPFPEEPGASILTLRVAWEEGLVSLPLAVDPANDDIIVLEEGPKGVLYTSAGSEEGGGGVVEGRFQAYRPGDVVLALGGIKPSSIAHARELLGGGGTPYVNPAPTDPSRPCEVKLLRRRGTIYSATPPLPPPKTLREYWGRVKGGRGPWAAAAPAHSTPAPAVRITSLCLPSGWQPSGGEGGGGVGGKWKGGLEALSWTLFCGPYCREVVGEYVVVGSAAEGGAGSASSSNSSSIVWRVKEKDAQGTPKVPGGLVLRTLREVAPEGLSPGITVSGDVRLVLSAKGVKKPLAAIWFHTAFLPLPDAAVAAAAAAAAAVAGKEVGCESGEEAVLQATVAAAAAAAAAVGAATTVTGAGAAAAAGAAPTTTTTSTSALLTSTDIGGGEEVFTTPAPTLGALFTACGMGDELTASYPPPSFRSLLLQKTQVGGEGGGGGLSALQGTAVFPKASLDKACKDRKHKVWGKDMRVAVTFDVVPT